jgi:hypothetical protein
MHNIRDVHPDKREPGGQPFAVLPGPTVSLSTVNRVLFFLFACLMVLVVMLGFLLFPANSLLTDLEARQRIGEMPNAASNPTLSAEVNALKGQLVELVGGSIESKLRNLEENIRADNVTAVDLGTIQDIRNDIKFLRNYSASAPSGRESGTAGAGLDNGQLRDEFSQLKSLIYISIASCGLMISAIGGVWLQNRYRLGHEKAERLLGKPNRH